MTTDGWHTTAASGAKHCHKKTWTGQFPMPGSTTRPSLGGLELSLAAPSVYRRTTLPKPVLAIQTAHGSVGFKTPCRPTLPPSGGLPPHETLSQQNVAAGTTMGGASKQRPHAGIPISASTVVAHTPACIAPAADKGVAATAQGPQCTRGRQVTPPPSTNEPAVLASSATSQISPFLIGTLVLPILS